jgi:hypothetical protein
MENYVLEDSLKGFAFDIEQYFVYVWRVHEVTEEVHGRVEVFVYTFSVKYTGYATLYAEALGIFFTKVFAVKADDFERLHKIEIKKSVLTITIRTFAKAGTITARRKQGAKNAFFGEESKHQNKSL